MAGIILGIVALALALMPCTGIFVLFGLPLSIPGVFLSLRGFGRGSSALALTGLLFSGLALALGAFWLSPFLGLHHIADRLRNQ